MARCWPLLRPGPRLNIKTVFPRYAIPTLKITRSWDRPTFNTGIHILVTRHLYIETPRVSRTLPPITLNVQNIIGKTRRKSTKIHINLIFEWRLYDRYWWCWKLITFRVLFSYVFDAPWGVINVSNQCPLGVHSSMEGICDVCSAVGSLGYPRNTQWLIWRSRSRRSTFARCSDELQGLYYMAE